LIVCSPPERYFLRASTWLANVPLYDQYDQVQDHTADFVAAIEWDKCFVRGTTRIIAVGHSLGGGLAQQAAFVEPRIRHVYAFDPSVVTGSTDARVRQLMDQNGARIAD
jgi:dienelactone hydrolase